MKIVKRSSARSYTRDGITSWLMASSLTTDSLHLTTSLVEMQPGGVQKLHKHDPEQCYFIIEGKGTMTVGSEEAKVGPGDCIFVPSGELHGLSNDGGVVLRYVSAAAPSWGSEALEELWPESSLGEES